MQAGSGSDKRRSVLLLVFGLLGILGLLGRCGSLVFNAVTAFHSVASQAAQDPASSILAATSMFFCALLLVPLVAYCLRQLNGQGVPPAAVPPIKLWQAAVLVAVWLFIIVAVSILLGVFRYGWAVAVPFFPLGVALPVAVLAWIGVGGIPAGSLRRLWASFSLGMVGSTVTAVALEYLVVGMAALAASIVVIAHPEWRTLLEQLRNQVASASNLEAAITILGPYLTNPLVLIVILIFAAGVGPMIEEAVKPAAVWLVGKGLRSPAEGFALGALCGAGFALLEGLLAASGASQMWGLGMAGRAVSSLMHITASGLTGWGIASARLEKRYGRLAAAYLLAVGIHGLWNGSVVLAVFGSLRFSLHPAQPDLLAVLVIMIGVGTLLLMLPLMLAVLPLLNHFLRRTRPAAAPVSTENNV